jgi:ribosomal-protein-alanine N-acetyltransferase
MTPHPTTSTAALRQTTLREMTWRDIPALTALEPVLFADDAWSEQTWWAELAGRPRRSYVVGELSGAVVGYAGIDCGGEVADVMTIAVAPAARGHGLGAALMRWVIARARRSGAEFLMLEVRADNAVAQRLYAAAGFEMLTVRRRYYQPGDVDALIMRLPLRELEEDLAADVSAELDDDLAEDLSADPTDEEVTT